MVGVVVGVVVGVGVVVAVAVGVGVVVGVVVAVVVVVVVVVGVGVAMTRALLITTDGLGAEISISSLKDMQDAVGGWIELVQAPGVNIYINEEGKLDGLPVNLAGTDLARALGVQLLPGDVLCGNVLVLGPVDRQGEDTDVLEQSLAMWDLLS